MYGYMLIGSGFFLLALAAFLHWWAVRVARREAEEHAQFLIETYGMECYRRAMDSQQAEPVPAGKEVAS